MNKNKSDKLKEIITEQITNTQKNTILTKDNITRLLESKSKKEQKYQLLQSFNVMLDEILEEQVEMVTEQEQTEPQTQDISLAQQKDKQLAHYKKRFQAYKSTLDDEGNPMKTYTEKLTIKEKDGFIYIIGEGSEYLDYIVLQKYDDKGNWLSDSSFLIGDDYNNLFVQQQNKNVNNLIDIVFGV